MVDIDTDATRCVMGMNLQGKGKVWMNHLTFEEVSKEAPLAPDTSLWLPANN